MSQRLFSLGRSTVVCLFTGELIDKKIHNAQPFVNDHVLWGEGGLGGEYVVLHKLRLMSSHSYQSGHLHHLDLQRGRFGTNGLVDWAWGRRRLLLRFRCHLVTSAAHCPFSNVARHCLWRVSSNPPLFKPPIKTNTSLFTQHALFRVSIYIVVCRLWPTGTNGLNLPWTLSTSDLSHNRLGTRRPPTQTQTPYTIHQTPDTRHPLKSLPRKHKSNSSGN